MPSKYQIISSLVAEKAQEITSSADRYTAFLTTAANNYKYSFHEQLMIYAQKPTATACADVETWNKLGRFVNKGTKGIALLVERDVPYKLRHVFDISDTNSYYGHTISLWQMNPHYEEAVSEALENQFGELPQKNSLGENLANFAGLVVDDNFSDYLSQLLSAKEGSFLEELDELNTEVWLKNTLKSSIGFMLLTRCGIDAKNYYSAEDFNHVYDFNTPETISILGAAGSDISEMILREIAATVKSLQQEEKKQVRTFAAHEHYSYDVNVKSKNERSFDHGTDLQAGGRLSASEPDNAGIPEGWEVWNAAAKLPAQPAKWDLHRDDAQRQAEQSLGGDRPESKRDDGVSDNTDVEIRGRDREPEGIGSDALGGNDEQHQEPGRGSSIDGSDLQLSHPLPSVQEQQDIIAEAEAERASAFSISQGDIDAIITRGSGVHHGKYRIYEQYLKQMTSADNIAFLKNEYGWGGAYPAVADRELDEMHDAKGIKISHGSISEPDASILLKWNKVEKRIGELIAADRYLNSAEKEHYPAYRKTQEVRNARWEIGKEFQSIIRDYNDFQEQLGNTDAKLNQYVLIDCGSEFGQGSKTTFTLGENNFILPLMRDAIHNIITENTHLTERCEAMLVSLDSDLAKPLEPTYDELNPTPEAKKEFRFSLGDAVYIGNQEYEVLSFNDSEVCLYDTQFPLFNKVMPRAEFNSKLAENPMNDHLRQVVEGIAPEIFVETNIGKVPVEDYREIVAIQNGFDSYDDLYRQGFRIGNGYDKAPENESTEGFQDGGIPAKEDHDDFDDVEPSAVREALAERGIVNSELVNPEALENDPLIRQVSADVERLSHPSPKARKKVSPFLLHPEISSTERANYQITDDYIGTGLPHERYQHNADAIKLLKKIESENRLATMPEQNILAQYVGWGGLADYFDERNSHYGELKELLTQDEYTAARESTLTAFYTPPVVIRSMYQALENMDFKAGNILEPSCGVGNFIGMKPEQLINSKIYGIELDSISGRIAQQLYQKSSIAVQGFEKTELPDSFFDVAIGNVPFGSFKVPDKKYNKYNFLIHDYFFARSLDKVRPSGIIAFITSKGTMDKENPSVRKYIAQRADLLGAIRLPSNTFKSAAGTEVTSDILFLQKRDRLIATDPDWVHLNTDANGLKMNQYFVDNPDMILGEMREVSGPFGPETACIAYPGQDLGEQLSDAIANIHAEITEYELDDLIEEDEDSSIPADPDVRNFSYAVVDGKIYYRENSRMMPVDVSVTAESRIKGMIAIRDCVRTLIDYQTEDYPDNMIADEQAKLNTLYDEFSEKYGLINSRANKSAFNSDSSFCLLSSLEVLDDDGNFIRKADMFVKRTIRQRVVVTSVDTASEALAVSLAERAKVDMPYMMELTGKSEQKILEDLTGVIFLNPQHTDENDVKLKYLPADEYLSGNVREKLEWAKRSAELYPEDYTVNVLALEAVQPKDLTASEISIRLGATWLPADVVEDFMFDLFDTPRYCQWNIHVHYAHCTGEWNIEGKTYDRSNIMVSSTYGTDRINGYKIIEQTLNLKDVRIFDYIEDANGKKTPVLNKKETAIAQGKQELIKQAFADWIWSDQNRRELLCKLYNEKFNSIRPREYDGSHLSLVGINPEIALRQHQLNAVARGLYGGNELLGHVVGAGKTYTIVAIAQESKRLGLAQKSLIVVPNHLTEQWAAEYLRLYPSANILVATAKDFEAKNRKRFCGRIATGDYDAVIIGHSQLEKIPMSIERQRYILEQQMEEIMDGIVEMKANKGDRFSIKQLERSKKAVQVKLDKLNDQSRKDDLVTFEELGVDRLFIDEAHYYKNLAAFTKMRNIGGISQTEAMKSSDLYMKCRYLDELTGGRGVVFATGTPISNTMVEMYTMQKYLQYNTLRRNDLIHFDAWASTFGETVTAIELAPEGTGYRAKTRFAKFYNLPELMAMFKEVADIQTADMLNLPVPKANYHNVVLKPSIQQKEMVDGLADRAERVRSRMVNSSEDNMLVITNDGRKLALDQRLMNELLPDSDTGKVSACADNVFEIWQRTVEQRSAQMVFCDLSTPHNDGHFNVYDALRDKLIAQGIPEEEIAYIHTAGTEAKKKEMFGKVRSGQVRVIIGSTQKMGAGTNVQQRLIALHHLDCPWRPADLQQREGRIIRQGNENPEVEIYTYVTENTFDSYLYQLVESKQKFIGQIMTSNSPVRSAEDIDETALSYAEIKALCTGNPHIKEKMDLDIAVQKLKLLKANHLSQKYALEDQIIKDFPQRISTLEQRIEGYKADMAHLIEHTHPNEDGFSPMEIEGIVHTEKKAAGSAILEACHAMTSPDAVPLGQYRGFSMELSFDSFSREYKITLKNELRHVISIGTDIFGNIQRLDNLLGGFEDRLHICEDELENSRTQLANAKEQVQKPFSQEDELKAKSARLDELNIMLNMDKTENEIVDDERDEDEPDERSSKEYER